MTRLIGSSQVETLASYGTLGFVDEACLSDTYDPDASEDSWLAVARGMAYLKCSSSVIRVRVRLESWTTVPPAESAQWSGSAEVDVVLPSGVLGVFTWDGAWKELTATLPSPGLYRLQLYWALNPEAGPFYSPLRSGSGALEAPAGHEQELTGVDQFCLARVWRLSTTVR